MPEAALKLLLIDDNPDSRFLLAKTLQRKFPAAAMLECQTSDQAVAMLRRDQPAAVIAHRTSDTDGTTLIRMLRKEHPAVPIVMVSGIDRQEAARLAGASCFLHYDEWLRIGSVVADLLKSVAAAVDPKSSDDEGRPAMP